MMNLDQVRIIDPILTQIAQGYKQADGVATFFGPAVSMNVRAGRTLVFGKEAFAAQSFLRSPGTNIEKIQAEFGTRSFALRQEAISWQIAEEVAAEAKNGALPSTFALSLLNKRVSVCNRAGRYKLQRKSSM